MKLVNIIQYKNLIAQYNLVIVKQLYTLCGPQVPD
jgi:hypothetical protein